MRDQEDDEDEKLFAEMQAAAANLPPRAAPQEGRQGHIREGAIMVAGAGNQGDAVATEPSSAFGCCTCVESEEADFPVPKRLAGGRGVDRQAKHRALAKLERPPG